MKILKKIILGIAEREIRDYTQKVSMGNTEQHGIILAHAYLILAQLIEKIPIIKKVIKSQDDIYMDELSDLILQTNSLIKEYINNDEMENASGVKLWNETFRCLSHPEFTHYGKEIWLYFTKAQKEADEYLDSLEVKFTEQENDNMVGKIKEAKNYISLVPLKYKS